MYQDAVDQSKVPEPSMPNPTAPPQFGRHRSSSEGKLGNLRYKSSDTNPANGRQINLSIYSHSLRIRKSVQFATTATEPSRCSIAISLRVPSPLDKAIDYLLADTQASH
jgi:hypothetical protein